MNADIVESESSAILRKYCNAMATYYGCTGHTKAELNDREAQGYVMEANRIGLILPDPVTAARMGTFNGPGSR